MANIGTVSFDVTANIAGLEMAASGANKSLESMASQAQKVSDGLTSAGRKMTTAITAPALAIGGLAVKAFSDFDAAMNESTAIMGDVSAELRTSMEEAARQVARDTTMTATQAGEAFFFLASAGFNATDAIAALPQVAKFAQAGMFDMAAATDMAADAQSAMGLRSKDPAKNLEGLVRVTDVLAKANILANGSIEQFSVALIKAAPSARAAGMSIEETTAILAAMADRGIKAEIAGTALAMVIPQLGQAARANEKDWKRLNVSLFDAQGAMLPFPDFLDQVKNALAGMSEEQVSAELAALGLDGQMGKTVLGLLEAGDQIRNYEKNLKNAGGAVDEIANNQLKSFQSRMMLLKNNVMDLAIELGRTLAPMVEKVAGVVTMAVEWFRSLDESTKKNIVVAVGLAAAIGPILLGLGALVGIIPSVVAGFGFIATAVGFLTGIAPIALAIAAAIGGIAVALNAADKEFNLFGEGGKIQFASWSEIWERLKALPAFFAIEAKYAFENVMTIGEVLFENLMIGATNWWNATAEIFSFMGESWGNVVEVMVTVWDTFIDNFIERFTLVKDLIAGDIGLGDFSKRFAELTLNPLAGLTENIGKLDGIELPIKIPLRDLGKELEAIQARKDAEIEAAMSINTEAVAKQTEATEKAAAIADEAATAPGGTTESKVSDQSSAALEAGSLAAFSATNRKNGTVEEEQLKEQKKIAGGQAKVIEGQVKMIVELQKLTNSLTVGGID